VRVVAERGFHAASVDLIAEEAGMSIGALYANFAGKDAVLLAAFDEHLRWFDEQLEAAVDADEPRDGFVAWIDALTREPDQFLLFVEFWSYAVRRPELRDELKTHMAGMRKRFVAAVTERLDGSASTLSPAVVADVILAIGRGVAFEKLSNPKGVDERAIADLVAALIPERSAR